MEVGNNIEGGGGGPLLALPLPHPDSILAPLPRASRGDFLENKCSYRTRQMQSLGGSGRTDEDGERVVEKR